MNVYSRSCSNYNRTSSYNRTTSYSRTAGNPYASVSNANKKLNISGRSSLLTGTNGVENMKMILAANSNDLKANNNVLEIKNGVNYKVKTLMHGYIGTSVKNNIATRVWDENSNDMAAINDNISTNKFVNCLEQIATGKAGSDVINTNFTNANEVLARFQSLGINPGKFEIKGSSKELFLDKNGWVSDYQEVKNAREYYNTKDFSKLGFTDKSKFIIDGKEYNIDKTGHLDIPEGVICTPSRVKIIK